MKKNRLAGAVYAALLLSPLPVSAATLAEGDVLAKEQFLVRGNGAEPSTLDPAFVDSGSPGDVIVNDMFEGLLIENLQGEIVGGLAQSWQTSTDGKTVTFHLKPTTWSDGQPITAEDFVFAWQRAVDPSTGNSTGFNLTTANVLNAQAVLSGATDVSQLGVAAPDAHTFVVTLTQPTPHFLSMMSIKTFAPVPKHKVEKFGENWTRPEHIVTSGAYTLKRWVPNEYVDVTKNPRYYDAEHTYIDGVRYLALSSQNAEFVRFMSGEIDMTNRVQLEYYQKLSKDNPNLIRSLRLLGAYVYDFNTQRAPFDNPDVRRALSMMIDRDTLVEKVTGQGEPPAYSVVPDIIPDYRAAQPEFASWDTTQRIETARALLKEAGYDDKHPLKITLTYNTSENHKRIALAIASMWKPLGVKVELNNMEWNAYLNAKSNGDFTVARSFAFGDFAEPSAVLNSFRCHDVNNSTQYCNEQVDKLLQSAAKASDQQQRYQYYEQAERLIVNDAPIIPLHFYKHTRLVNAKLKGFPDNNPKGNIYAKDMYFVE